MEKLQIVEANSDQFSSSSNVDDPIYLRLLLIHPSISKSGIGVHGPEQVVSLNEAHIYEISNDTRPLLSNHQETFGLPYVHQNFDATSPTPVLTGPTSKPPNTNAAPSLAPFDDVMPHQQCPNGTTVTTFLTLCTSKPPSTESKPSSVPSDSEFWWNRRWALPESVRSLWDTIWASDCWVLWCERNRRFFTQQQRGMEDQVLQASAEGMNWYITLYQG